MIRIKELNLVCSRKELATIPEGKILINTINAHSYNTARKDKAFQEALLNGDYLIPDGASIVKACRWLKSKSQPEERIAGWDLFEFEMTKLQRKSEMEIVKDEQSKTLENPSLEHVPVCKPKVMFMGSSENVLELIRKKVADVYPRLEVVTYSPPYKPEFSDEDNALIIKAINDANPDLLWIGMTAPKQEKWAFQHWSELDINCHVGTVGAVFDFFAGTYKRAPKWWQNHSLEWLYRLLNEPRRMWRRYIIGNTVFLWNVLKEKME